MAEKIEIICTTMHQNGFGKVGAMGISSDVLFTNQADRMEYSEEHYQNFEARMVTTNTRGVGLNRNLGILHSVGDILLMADDDIIYTSNYYTMVQKEFAAHKDADMILFSMRYTKNGKTVGEKKLRSGKLHIRDGFSYAGPQIAVRKKSILREGVFFNQLFGGGCVYGSGEDTLFILDCIKKGFRVYTSEFVLCETAKDESTWFRGFDEKYYYDDGASAAYALRRVKLLYFIYHTFAKRKSSLDYRARWRALNAGYVGFNKNETYTDWKNASEKG